MRIGVGTIQHGRAVHLDRQARAVGRLAGCARYVVVSMDLRAPSVPGADVIALPATEPDRLPLAAARNAALTALADLDLAVMLDVDCIPDEQLLVRYAEAALAEPGGLLVGPVAYLPSQPDSARDLAWEVCERARLAPTKRPFPASGCARESRHELFWSLSFAVRPQVHARIGGFDPAYVGYGAEDTDYAWRARAAGVPLVTVAGAWAYHQHHDSPQPPVQHVAAIIDNAHRFRARWGTWPMSGWLAQFADLGLVVWDPEGETLRLTAASDSEGETLRLTAASDSEGETLRLTAAPTHRGRPPHPGPPAAASASSPAVS